jgi:hypothetical protein
MMNRFIGVVRGTRSTDTTRLPNLVISQKVLTKINAAAKQHMEDETGEAMVGLLMPPSLNTDVPTLYVLDTIAPDESAVRQMHTFQQGDERQQEFFIWLSDNWDVYRKDLQPKDGLDGRFDVPLQHMGDWHKQPGHMIAPSGGDLMSAITQLVDSELNFAFLLVPIVTLNHWSADVTDGFVNFMLLPQEDGSFMRIDWWYIDLRTNAFVPIVPAVYPEARLPSTTKLPWHLLDDARAAAEFQALRNDGLFATIVLWQVNDKPPLEVCFLVVRAGSPKVLLLTTHYDYPNTAPQARIAPAFRLGADVDMFKIFEECWGKSEAVTLKDWHWSKSKTLLDFVVAIEKAYDLPSSPPSAPPTPAPVSVAEQPTAHAESDDTQDDD